MKEIIKQFMRTQIMVRNRNTIHKIAHMNYE